MFRKSPHLDIHDITNAVSNEFVDLWSGKKYIVKALSFIYSVRVLEVHATLLCSKDDRVKKVLCFSLVIDWTTMESNVEPIPKLSGFVKDAFGMCYRIVKDG